MRYRLLVSYPATQEIGYGIACYRSECSRSRIYFDQMSAKNDLRARRFFRLSARVRIAAIGILVALAATNLLAQTLPPEHGHTLSFCGSAFELRLPSTYQVTRRSGKYYRVYEVTKDDVEPFRAKFKITLTSNPDMGPVISGFPPPAATVLGTETHWNIWTEDTPSPRTFHRELMVVLRTSRKQPEPCGQELRFIVQVSGTDPENVERMSGLIENIVRLHHR
jgi:hypothetical protein